MIKNIIFLAMITLFFACSSSVTDLKIKKENAYCRAIVNTKDGNMSLVTFNTSNITEEKHWSNVIYIDGAASQVMTMHYIASGGKFLISQQWIKNIKHDKYYYRINPVEEISWNKDWAKVCMPFKYHVFMDELFWNRDGVRPDYYFSDEVLKNNRYVKEKTLDVYSDDIMKRKKLCYCNDLWCAFEKKQEQTMSCEVVSLRQNIMNIDFFDNSFVSEYSLDENTCNKKYSIEQRFFLVNTFGWDEKHVKYYPKVKGILSDDEIDKLEREIDIDGFRPVLFTYGNHHRRWFGHLVRETDDGQYRRIELPFMTEGLEKILDEIENAPDGCGHFDWDTVELVNRSGQRYKIANGDYESIAGIYWLKPDDAFSLDMLDDEPEHPMVIDEGYEAPKPQPNCRYFSDEGRRERWEAKRRLCYQCEGKYGSQMGTGIEPEETCAEFDRDYDEVKDTFEILYE